MCIRDRENTEENENHINEEFENDHGQKDSTEPLPENIDKDTQDQEGNKKNQEEEIIDTDPLIETIMEDDNNGILESPNEPNETMSKDTKTPEGEVTAGDTVENLLKEPEPTELLSFQEMMVECNKESNR